MYFSPPKEAEEMGGPHDYIKYNPTIRDPQVMENYTKVKYFDQYFFVGNKIFWQEWMMILKIHY